MLPALCARSRLPLRVPALRRAAPPLRTPHFPPRLSAAPASAPSPLWSACTARVLPVGLSPQIAGALSHVRTFSSKRSRTGRLQHFRFGTDRVKGRWYYRFHKIIGKWTWRKYTERFTAPRALENRQRFIPSVSGNYRQTRESASWLWRLPKALAAATTPDQVLEVWITFRHKVPKRTYHYFKVLKRLVDVGGCDPNDWRLRFITSRLHSIHRKVLNLPRLATYYAQLKATKELEHVTRFLYPMLPRYSPQQLVLTAHAFGLARLQDKRLMTEVARLLEPKLADLSPADLVRVTEAFAATEVHHYAFLLRVSAQAQVRAQQAAEGNSPPGSAPSFEQLVDLAAAFAQLKLQDYSFFELCSRQAAFLLENGLPGASPVSLARLCSSSAKLKIHDVALYSLALAHAADHWYDYPAASLAELGAAIAPAMPRGNPEIDAAYRQMLATIRNDRDMLTLKGVEHAVRFMAELDHKDEFAPGTAKVLRHRFLELRDEGRERYDVARVTEVFARREPGRNALFSTLCKHLHRHLSIFQPIDFVRFTRGLAMTTYRDDRVVHALGKWARKRSGEFTATDWHRLIESLASMRAREWSLQQMRDMGPPEPPNFKPLAAAKSGSDGGSDAAAAATAAAAAGAKAQAPTAAAA
eukprot:TRINITY_DN8017_c0_g1_i1.p1 TRINITY_DN8017_c0_g1~~TRINITY_DN8017_c0_g1_i1.p1  ORF type:complete len:641 (+),score=146.68 TRINITY_DN8017_c0_g1_i1:158-2080(+)